MHLIFKILFLLYFLTPIFFKSQDYCLLFTGFSDDKNINVSERIRQHIRKEIEDAKKRQMNDSSSFTNTGDSLFIKLFDRVYGVNYKFAFELVDTSGKNKCIYQEVEYDCSPCALEYLKTYLSYYKFRSVDGTNFWSEPLWKTEMSIDRNKSSTGCLRLKFRYIKMDWRGYKNKYKTLSKLSKEEIVKLTSD